MLPLDCSWYQASTHFHSGLLKWKTCWTFFLLLRNVVNEHALRFGYRHFKVWSRQLSLFKLFRCFLPSSSWWRRQSTIFTKNIKSFTTWYDDKRLNLYRLRSLFLFLALSPFPLFWIAQIFAKLRSISPACYKCICCILFRFEFSKELSTFVSLEMSMMVVLMRTLYIDTVHCGWILY